MPDIWMDVDLAVTVPVNIMPLIAVADFKTVLASETYNEAGLELIWNFVTTAGVQTHTAITPTDTGGTYDWVNVGHGMYNIELPDSVNNTEGFGWFTGVATDALPWRGPVIGFRAAALNNALIDSAWSTTRGLAGTALPDAAADAAGGLAISDAGGLNLDAILADTAELQTDWVNGGRLDLILDIIAADTTTDIPALIADVPTVAEFEARTIVAANYATAAALTVIDDFLDTEIAAILADTNELQTDWVNGGRLDLILDIIAADTTTDIPALIADVPTVAEFEARTLVAADYTIVSDLGTVQTGDAFARLGAPVGASISADIAVIEAQTDDIGTAGAGLTAIPWNAAWDTEVESEANDALVAQNLDHLIKVAKDTNWATTVTKESVIDLLTSKDAAQNYDRATDSLEAIQDDLTTVSAGVAATITATANTETTGTLVAGTYAATYLSNGTYYTLAPVTPAVGGYGINAYLTFGAASGQYINSVTIRGFFQNATGSARFCHVGAYNYLTSSIDILSDSTSRMNHATANATYTYALLSAHQKADGEVRIYFLSPSVTTGDRLNVDQVLVNVNTAGASASDIAAAVKQNMIALYYPDGVWLDTVNGTDGTVTGVNGIQTFPVKTIAAAYALCASLSLNMIHFATGSNVTAVTLTQSAAGWSFYGPGKIDLGGQIISDAIFDECYSVYGTSTGDDASFYRCQIGSGGLTLDHSYVTACRIKGAITLIANADPIIFHDCIDATGSGADFELIFVANATAVIRNFQGAITLKNMAATNSVVIDGASRVTIDATSTAGSITVRGFAPELTGASTFTTAPNTGTITQDARYSNAAINAEVDAALNTAIPGSPTADSINERIATMDTGVTLTTAAVDAILDDVIEGSLTMRQALRIFLAALAGKSSGGGTATIKFRNLADDGDRITATVDANGNRTASTIDGA